MWLGELPLDADGIEAAWPEPTDPSAILTLNVIVRWLDRYDGPIYIARLYINPRYIEPVWP